jgi:hypothetical protein
LLLNLINPYNNLHKRRGKSANKGTNNEDSSSSEYLVDDDDQGDRNGDDDAESNEQPQPIANEVLLLSSK